MRFPKKDVLVLRGLVRTTCWKFWEGYRIVLMKNRGYKRYDCLLTYKLNFLKFLLNRTTSNSKPRTWQHQILVSILTNAVRPCGRNNNLKASQICLSIVPQTHLVYDRSHKMKVEKFAFNATGFHVKPPLNRARPNFIRTLFFKYYWQGVEKMFSAGKEFLLIS